MKIFYFSLIFVVLAFKPSLFPSSYLPLFWKASVIQSCCFPTVWLLLPCVPSSCARSTSEHGISHCFINLLSTAGFRPVFTIFVFYSSFFEFPLKLLNSNVGNFLLLQLSIPLSCFLSFSFSFETEALWEPNANHPTAPSGDFGFLRTIEVVSSERIFRMATVLLLQFAQLRLPASHRRLVLREDRWP